MDQILEPVIRLANEGCVLSENSSKQWQKCYAEIKSAQNREDLIASEENPPLAGSHVKAPKLAKTLETIATKGPEEFYVGTIGQNIVECVQRAGGLLTLDDMQQHFNYSNESCPEEPAFVEFKGFRIWEMKPSTLGIVVLVALNILETFNLKDMGHNSADYIHVVVEAIGIAFDECWDHLYDSSSTYKHLLTKEFSAEKRKAISFDKSNLTTLKRRELALTGDTAYVAAVDEDGNACSLISSVSGCFGSTHIPDDCGFVLHDRGKFFSLDDSKKNAFGPTKRPLHTIIPSIVTDIAGNDLLAAFGVVGRWMQPQGHVQVLLNMIIFGMNPQEAVDQPRFCAGEMTKFMNFSPTFCVYLEHPTPSVTSALTMKGHCVRSDSSHYGCAQVIAKSKLWSTDSPSDSLWFCGNDSRLGGSAILL